MDSMEQKIRAFLQGIGYEGDPGARSTVDLLRYFEEEYGIEIMGMLEHEWLDEQIERDLSGGYFGEVRKHIPESDRADYDASVARIVGQEY